ncbi:MULTISPECIES: hypothetical protein [Aquitalea]|uniref:Flagellar protein FliT n=1 Tax=Aquitalea magnusonii TaxID=332411 RepID=A0A318JC91_9NEIS|nr:MULTISPECIES: hypothetical protein [Aquitalea]PXX44378.1 hypothetical protein DFR38_11360 [Aquitalea magnusonii]
MNTSIQPAQIDAMLARLADALAACEAQDFELVTRLAAQQESELADLLQQLQPIAAHIPAETRAKLHQLVAQRELLQQQIADWIARMREEMQTVSQNSRLLKTYSL